MVVMQRLMNKANFAKLAGVHPSTITRLSKTSLKDAMVGTRVDAAHPEAVNYLNEKGIAKNYATEDDPNPPPITSEFIEENKKIIEVTDDISAFADMTLRELTERFGTDESFKFWLGATKTIEEINEKRLKNAQTQGTLISRKLVHVGVIDTFNSAHLRLLKDGAKSISAGVISKHESGAGLADIEDYVSDILGSFIKPVKAKIARVLKNA